MEDQVHTGVIGSMFIESEGGNTNKSRNCCNKAWKLSRISTLKLARYLLNTNVPKPKRTITAIRLLRRIFNFQRVGIGMTSIITSVTNIMTA